MKIRKSYVSNSSSASFVVVLREHDYGTLNTRIVLSKENEILLQNFGFKYMKGMWQWCLDSTEKVHDIDDYKPEDEVCMYMTCVCNEDEIYDFLFENHIPFKALCSYDTQLWVYDGKSDYYEIFTNYGTLFEMHGNNREMFDKFYIKDTIPYEKVSLTDKVCDSSAGYQIKKFAESMMKAGEKAKKYFTEEEFNKMYDFINEIASEEIDNMKNNNGF